MFAQKHHAEIDRLAAAFIACPIGETLTHETLKSEACIDAFLYGYARYRALRQAQREAGVVFITVHGVGYKRATLEEAPQIGRTARAYIGRKAARAARSISTVINHSSNGFPPEALKASYREIAVLGALNTMARRQPAKTIPLPTAESGEVVAREFMASFLRSA